MWLLAMVVGVALLIGLVMFVLAAAAVIAALIGIASFLLPVVLIVAGVRLLARALRGPDRRRRTRPAERQTRHAVHPAAGNAHQHAAPPSQPSPRPTAPPRPTLPIDVQVKVEQIKRKADVLLGYADRFSPFSHDLYIVRQTAADYLPRTIDAYLKVPGIADPALGQTGARALDELKAQLHLLDTKLDEIAADLQRSDLNGLLANRRFLEERFGAHDRESELSTQRHGSDAA